MKLCSYGCGNPAVFVTRFGKDCCSKGSSGCPVVKEKNSQGVKLAYKTGKKDRPSIAYQSLPKETKDKMAWSRGKQIVPNSEMLVENSKYSNLAVRKRIADGNLIDYKCQRCGIDSWNGESITLELDHINGQNNDHRIENLRFLCPNCHSQTETYKGKNKNSGQIKVSDEMLLTAYKNCNNIRQTLLDVGLAAKGGNYKRLKTLIEKNINKNS